MAMKKTNRNGENCAGSGTHRTHKRSVRLALDGTARCNVCDAVIVTK